MRISLLIPVMAGFLLAACARSALETDYGSSFRSMNENQVYDSTTLTRPSFAAVEGADPIMIDLAVTTMRTEAADRKEVPKPLVVSIGGQGGQ
jgi:uncharacterized protein YgiB involved in biofilm formation